MAKMGQEANKDPKKTENEAKVFEDGRALARIWQHGGGGNGSPESYLGNIWKLGDLDARVLSTPSTIVQAQRAAYPTASRPPPPCPTCIQKQTKMNN